MVAGYNLAFAAMALVAGSAQRGLRRDGGQPVDRADGRRPGRLGRPVSRTWKRRLEERRRAIERLEHELTGRIGCGCLSMKACLLLNPDDALGQRGPGPVRLQQADAGSAPTVR